ncbi:hypothetical protein EMEDMD4_590019 [Sinorhizobium medicae]|uniref:Uncharacterized protein n=1 Tax=Sinorhizobium medicae TaxID=110321 RepID=A0A508X4F7_9HYPH|nr:hypothetical protein EMEDMD4_590019 [Sinorhizobium medicae]
MTQEEPSAVLELLLAPWHEVASNIDERLGDGSSILMGSWSFCLADLADWRDDVAGGGMAANDGPPQLRREPGSHQKADVPGPWH